MIKHDSLWVPYVVCGQAHPGVMVDAGFTKNDGEVFIARVEPDGHTNPHVHSGQEIVEIIDGEAEITVNGEKRVLLPGQTYTVAAGMCHSVRNLSSKPLFIRARFNPPFHTQRTSLSQ